MERSPQNKPALALGLVVLAGCRTLEAPPPPPPQTVLVQVSAGDGAPLSGIAVRPSVGSSATTNDQGIATLLLGGDEGTKVALTVACPEGYAAPAAAGQVVVRRASRPPRIDIPCKPYQHGVLVAFKSTGAVNVPILYLGQEIAKTDDAGYALVELEPKAGETLEFTFDTSDPEQRFLRPQSPQRTVLVPEGEETFTIEQKFVEERPKARRAAPKKVVVAKRLDGD